MRTAVIIQARMGSTRLPGKVLCEVVGRPMIALMCERVRKAERVDEIVLAIPSNARDDALAEVGLQLGLSISRGSETDVLQRYLDAAEQVGADVIVRLTADCPLSDPELIDRVIEERQRTGADYCSNIDPRTYPDGLDIEAFTIHALRLAAECAISKAEREHVTPWLKQAEEVSRAAVYEHDDNSQVRWTVDEAADLEVVRNVFDHFAPDIYFGWREVLRLAGENPELFAANAGIFMNEGSPLSEGQKLWKRAKQIIPGGNMLLSKRSEMFLPQQWPSYFSGAKGCTVWDLDGRELKDMSLMGVGTNTLGYGHPEVDEAVRGAVDAGNLSTLNCPEEVWLAEKLIQIAPFADMARFTRAGGEANAVAVRIARAASARDGVAVCGYHGWHDWYLSANLGDNDSLAGHLLPGLDPAGVPGVLRNVVQPFEYNAFNALESLVANNSIGVIKMEVMRNREPEDNFLQKVRDLATKNCIVLIFDECTSGFRETFGGLYLKYGVEPDIAVFSKTLGNGYAISAVLGRHEVMEAAQSTFISSTFWTERIGPTAALKALEVMERERSWERITATGRVIRDRWQELADRHGLKIQHAGLPAIATFSFTSPQALGYKTLMTQEMLDRGWLAGPATYACLAHEPEVIDRYTEDLDSVFRLIAECENGRSLESMLRGPICHSGFRRIN